MKKKKIKKKLKKSKNLKKKIPTQTDQEEEGLAKHSQLIICQQNNMPIKKKTNMPTAPEKNIKYPISNTTSHPYAYVNFFFEVSTVVGIHLETCLEILMLRLNGPLILLLLRRHSCMITLCALHAKTRLQHDHQIDQPIVPLC